MSKIILAGVLVGVGVQTIEAGTLGSSAVETSRPVFTLSLGPVWQNSGETQTFYLTPEIEKTYKANRESSTLGVAEVFLGIQKTLSPSIMAQLGMALAATGNAKPSGFIWDDADPQFDNYTYNYRVQHSHMALKGKLLKNMNWMFTPWVSGSLGLGFNKARGFNNVPTIFEAIANANFADHTQTAFTYTLGAGAQYSLNNNWQIGAGYEFADWGKNHLNRSAGQTLNSGLYLNHIYTNGLMFNLTYLA